LNIGFGCPQKLGSKQVNLNKSYGGCFLFFGSFGGYTLCFQQIGSRLKTFKFTFFEVIFAYHFKLMITYKFPGWIFYSYKLFLFFNLELGELYCRKDRLKSTKWDYFGKAAIADQKEIHHVVIFLIVIYVLEHLKLIYGSGWWWIHFTLNFFAFFPVFFCFSRPNKKIFFLNILYDCTINMQNTRSNIKVWLSLKSQFTSSLWALVECGYK
jgi:hypothetical protein